MSIGKYKHKVAIFEKGNILYKYFLSYEDAVRFQNDNSFSGEIVDL